MRIAIVGPGALGSFFAAALVLRSGHDVLLVDHDPGRAARLNESGLHLIEGGEEFACRVQTTADVTLLESIDLCLLCVKAHSVPSTLRIIAPRLGRDNLLITFQNGIFHLDLLKGYSGSFDVAVGVTAQGANLVTPGVVRHAGTGPTKVGLWSRTQADDTMLAQSADILSEAGIATEVVSNIASHVWAKLFVNVGINALTMLYQCPNGKLLTLPGAMERMERAVREAEAVARALGIPILADPLEATMKVCRATAENISSMLQDARKKRRTEIDAINGAIVTAAGRLGIAVPENAALLREVRRLEEGYS